MLPITLEAPVPCRLRHLPEMLTPGLRILTTDMLAIRVGHDNSDLEEREINPRPYRV
jgi:hypothetical protein